MNCPDAREWFSAWADGALTAAERSDLDAHLSGCPECGRELERFEGTLALVRRAERPRAPAGFVDRVLERVRPVPWHRRWARRLFVPLSVKLPVEAAAAVLVAALAAYMVQKTPELDRAARQEMYPTPAPYSMPAAPAAVPAPSADLRQRPAESAAPARARRPEAERDAGATAPRSASAPPREDAARPGLGVPSVESSAAPPRGERGRVSETSNLPAAAKSAADTASAPPARTSGGAPPGATPKLEAPPSAAPRPEPPQIASGQPGGSAPPSPPSQGGAAQQGGGAKQGAGVESLDMQRTVEPAPRPRPALDERADAARVKKAVAPAPESAASRVLPAPDVAGRLTVKDGEAAERALANALARAGGAMLARRQEAGGTVVDVIVPRGGYAGFGRALAGIGSWVADSEPTELPDQVRVTLRLVQ